MQPEEQLINQRLEKLSWLRQNGVEPFAYRFEQKHHISDITNKKAKKTISIAGRVVSLRKMGKASFGDLEDATGRIQFYIKEDIIGKKAYEIFRKIDLGDIIGLEGGIFKTKTKELSVKVKKLTLLTKSLRPLPEKWHGLQDPELRYRQRYLDLIANKDVREIFIKRTKIISLVREFLNSKGFLEVEIPTLQTVYGGAEARPFKTHLNALDMNLFLSISPELHLKRLLVGQFEGVYTICKNFRNEGVDRTHNPEFTMMECYWAYKDYNDMMKLTEELVVYIVKIIHKKTKIKYQNQTIDFKLPWKRMTMFEALKNLAKIDVEKMTDDQLSHEVAKLPVTKKKETRDEMINALFEELVGPKLIQPTFIKDYPLGVCPLTKLHRKDKRLVERFEGFINGVEIANAYSELNDPIDQMKRLQEQEEKRKHGDEEAEPMDEDFIRALQYGMPPTGGLGIGIDRLVMFLTNAPSIKDVILFPLLKPKSD